MKNFFRKDLKLNQKRWHRGIKVTWILLSIAVVGFIFFVRYDSDSYLPYKEFVCDIKDRVSNKIVDVKDLIVDWEYLLINPGSYNWKYDIKGLIDIPKWHIWCSKSWNKDGLIELRKQNKWLSLIDANTDLASKKYDQIAKDMNNNPCILKWSDEHPWLYYNGSLTLHIYKLNTPNKFFVGAMRILSSIGIFLIYIVICILLYYKGIIYIIYGSSKKNN